MNISSVTANTGQQIPASIGTAASIQTEVSLSMSGNFAGMPGAASSAEPSEVARQFEAILLRQILNESMKGLIEGGEGQQNYGYFISEALADGISKGGGMGLRSILEVQLRGQGDARKAAQHQIEERSSKSEVSSMK